LKKSASPTPEAHGDLRPIILGVGNLLLGDEGIGVLAVRRLETSDLAERADIIDGGTGGFHLLEYFQGRPRLILIDAAADGAPPGTVSHLEPRFASDFPRSLSAHDIGLRDLIEAASLTADGLPRMDLITVSVESRQAMTLDVSAAVLDALPEVERRVRELLEKED